MTPRDGRIADKIFELLGARAPGATICPSDVARSLEPDDEAAWRALMPEIREVADRLRHSGYIRVTAHGETLASAVDAKGPIRLGLQEPRLPRGKHDMAAARALVAAGYPAVAPVLRGMLEWVQDQNWPVAFDILLPFLQQIGLPLAPYLREIFEGDDEDWQYVVLQQIVKWNSPLSEALRDVLERIANDPTPAQRRIGLDEQAREALEPDDA